MPLRECVRGVYSEVSAGKHKARCILVASGIIAPFEISLTARERATYRSLDARKSKRKWGHVQVLSRDLGSILLHVHCNEALK